MAQVIVSDRRNPRSRTLLVDPTAALYDVLISGDPSLIAYAAGYIGPVAYKKSGQAALAVRIPDDDRTVVWIGQTTENVNATDPFGTLCRLTGLAEMDLKPELQDRATARSARSARAQAARPIEGQLTRALTEHAQRSADWVLRHQPADWIVWGDINAALEGLRTGVRVCARAAPSLCGDAEARALEAAGSGASLALFERTVLDPSLSVRMAAAGNPACPAAELDAFLRDPHLFVRQRAVENPRLALEWQYRVLSWAGDVRARLAENPSSRPGVLLGLSAIAPGLGEHAGHRLYRLKSRIERLGLSAHEQADALIELQAHLGSNHPVVRAALACNNGPPAPAPRP